MRGNFCLLLKGKPGKAVAAVLARSLWQQDEVLLHFSGRLSFGMANLIFGMVNLVFGMVKSACAFLVREGLVEQAP